MYRNLLLAITFFLFCLTDALAGSPSPYPRRPDSEQKNYRAPMAQMMLYEAAEEAVEEGYARIIPEESSSGQNNADTAKSSPPEAAKRQDTPDSDGSGVKK